MDGDLANARGTFSSFIIAFPGTKRELNGQTYSYQTPKKGTLLLGSITLILPMVFMKPSSHLKVTAIISLIITGVYWWKIFGLSHKIEQGV